MGAATGPVPFSSFMTTPAFLRKETDTVVRFTLFVCRTQRWIAERPAAEVADAVRAAFPGVPFSLLTRILDRYQREETWARDPILRRPGFDALQRILLNGGFVAREHRYEDLVDVEIAGRVVQDEKAGR